VKSSDVRQYREDIDGCSMRPKRILTPEEVKRRWLALRRRSLDSRFCAGAVAGVDVARDLRSRKQAIRVRLQSVFIAMNNNH